MRKLILVDDDAEFRGLVTPVLEKRDYSVRQCANGTEGLAAYEKEVPDAILLDVKMPGMSGIETLRELKKRHPDFKTPVVILTNDSSLDTISEGAELGIRSYVMKANESLVSLADTVDRVFAHH